VNVLQPPTSHPSRAFSCPSGLPVPCAPRQTLRACVLYCVACSGHLSELFCSCTAVNGCAQPCHCAHHTHASAPPLEGLRRALSTKWRCSLSAHPSAYLEDLNVHARLGDGVRCQLVPASVESSHSNR